MLIKKGTILYHGTSTDARFFSIKGPAWFTLDINLATIFATEFGGDKGQTPRIYCFRAKRNLNLIELSREEIINLEEKITKFKGRFSNAAREFCKEGKDGWAVKNYDSCAEELGDPDSFTIHDIMICDPKSCFDYVEQKPIMLRHYLDCIWLHQMRPLLESMIPRKQLYKLGIKFKLRFPSKSFKFKNDGLVVKVVNSINRKLRRLNSKYRQL